MNYHGDYSDESKSYQEDLDKTAFGLKNIEIICAEFDDRDRVLLVDKLAEDVNLKLEGITDKSFRKELSDKYFRKVISNIYGIQNSSLNNDKEYKAKFEGLIDLLERQFLGSEGPDNIRNIEGLTKYFNENRKQRVKEDMGKNAGVYSISDKNTQIIYNQLVRLSEKLPKSEFEIVRDELVKTANEELDKGVKSGENR